MAQSIASQLKAWRKRKKYTQAKAARILGSPISSYRNWEQGRTIPCAGLAHTMRQAIRYL
jgi:transcriptional regulator with XRE-family HTH domain